MMNVIWIGLFIYFFIVVVSFESYNYESRRKKTPEEIKRIKDNYARRNGQNLHGPGY